MFRCFKGAAATSALQAMRGLRPLSLGTTTRTPTPGISSHQLERRLHSQNSVSGTTKESTLGFYMRQYSTMGPQQQPQGHSTDPVSDHSGAEFSGTAKPYDAIPSPKRIPLLGMSRDFMKFSPSQMAHFVQGRVDNLGKLFREKLAPGLPEFLFVLDPGDVAKVFRADGKYPMRLPFSDWINVRNELNIPHGLFLS